MSLTAANATPAQIERHVEYLSHEINFRHEFIKLAPHTPDAIKARSEKAFLERSMRYFINLYRKKGGTAMIADMPSAHISATPPQVVKRRAQNAAREQITDLIAQMELEFSRVRSALDNARKRAADNWVIDMLLYQAGGFSATTLTLANMRSVPQAKPIAISSSRHSESLSAGRTPATAGGPAS